MNFDPVTELHSVDHFGEALKSPQPAPAALRAHAELEDHREHSVAGQTPLGAISPVAHGGEGGDELIEGALRFGLGLGHPDLVQRRFGLGL